MGHSFLSFFFYFFRWIAKQKIKRLAQTRGYLVDILRFLGFLRRQGFSQVTVHRHTEKKAPYDGSVYNVCSSSSVYDCISSSGPSVCSKDGDPKQGAETGALHPPTAARDTPLGGWTPTTQAVTPHYFRVANNTPSCWVTCATSATPDTPASPE